MTPRAPSRYAVDAGSVTITTERSGNRCLVAVSGEVDLATARPVDDALRRAEATDARSIVLDLSQLDFMDATGVALLMKASTRSRSDSNRLTVIRPPRNVMRVLLISGVAKILPFAN